MARKQPPQPRKKGTGFVWFLSGLLVGIGAYTIIVAARGTRGDKASEVSEGARPPPGATMWPGELSKVKIRIAPAKEFMLPQYCPPNI